jgi:hypothetical protein
VVPKPGSEVGRKRIRHPGKYRLGSMNEPAIAGVVLFALTRYHVDRRA